MFTLCFFTKEIHLDTKILNNTKKALILLTDKEGLNATDLHIVG